MGFASIVASLGTHVSELYPTLNFHTQTGLGLREGSGNDAIAYLYWSRPFPLKATILNAKIRLTSTAMPENVTHTLTLLRIGVPWSQTKMTWNTRPVTFISGGKSINKVGPIPGAGGTVVWEFDVTDWMQTISNGGNWQGVQIKTNEALLRYLYSENNTNVGARPVLEITWSDAPAAPTGLSPSGGRAVGVPKPVVRATYFDVSGSTQLAYVQVQANATDLWTAPTFDSGAVPSSVPELDLALTFPRTATVTTTNTSTNITAAAATFETADIGATITGTGIPGGATITAVAVGGASATLSAAATASGAITATITRSFAALADGASTFWRIRFQDAAGVWSSWSSATSFKYDIKGTLTVNSPSSGTPTVEDTTPPILWSFVGETQSAYQLQVRHDENTGQVIDWDSGKITSTDQSITVPSGKITETGKTFTLTVRVWDNKQREAVPNSPTYQEVVRDFTFVPGATTGTAALTAVAQDPVPKVVLTWTRSVAPDGFNILRNGKVIAGNIAPELLFVSGTTYTYTDQSPSPGRALTYSVQAVVNNVASASNATAVVTVRSSGIWLRDPSAALELCIMQAEDRDYTLGEQAAVFQSIASNANKVAINQSLGGLEGRVEGTLINIYGKTASEWRDIYLKLRALRVKKFYLTIGDYTFLAVCQEFAYGQKAIPEPWYKVGFNFYQQDSINSIQLGS
jgi:hypothetical protein